MKYSQQIVLKNGKTAVLRNGVASDGSAVFDNFNLTHAETDFLLSYPDENSFDLAQERQFLIEQEESNSAVELCAFVNGQLAGTAGIEPVGTKDKVKHRADFGISVDRAYWRKGIGRALTDACIQCAKQAGYAQIELNVVSTNTGAIALYRSAGFAEYGRNPRGFRTRDGRWQELVLMRLELEP